MNTRPNRLPAHTGSARGYRGSPPMGRLAVVLAAAFALAPPIETSAQSETCVILLHGLGRTP
ncbi:MAG: hypothetical protein OXJ56_04170, partial [Rhodospirillaceae bacterium]|nr:hypothetical protein [Rhodospirillaceae bacterium]